MKLDSFLISFVVFSAVIVFGVFLIQDVNTTYDKNMSTEEFNETFNIIDEMYNISQDMKDHTLEGEIEEDEPWESMIKGSYSAVRQTKNTFRLTGNIIEIVSDTLHIPPFLTTFALTALTILVIFSIIYLVMKVSR